jgi:hypothetical protein
METEYKWRPFILLKKLLIEERSGGKEKKADDSI